MFISSSAILAIFAFHSIRGRSPASRSRREEEECRRGDQLGRTPKLRARPG